MPKKQEPSSTSSGLLTHHVFLDTQVYHQLGHNPDNPVLKTLGERVSSDRLVLHITDITFSEIKRQLAEFVEEAAQALRKAKRQVGRWKHRHPDIVTQDIQDLDSARVAEAAFQRFYNVVRHQWGATYHEASTISAVDIFNDYFNRRQPFAKEGSKEFPDAFVIKCLEAWCKSNSETMYFVTEDKAVTEAVSATSVLLPMAKLSDLLALATAKENPDIRKEAEALLANRGVLETLEGLVDDNISELIPVYTGDEYPEGEVSDHTRSGDVSVVGFEVIAASDSDVAAIVEARIPLTITLDFEDRSMAMYDNEDGVYFGAETAETEFDDEARVRIFTKLRRNPPELVDLKILTGEIHVHEPYNFYD